MSGRSGVGGPGATSEQGRETIDQLADGSARLDLGRTARTGTPEAVYCGGKSIAQCVDIVRSLLAASTDAVIATRATPAHAVALVELAPPALDSRRAAPDAEAITLVWAPRPAGGGSVAVVSAGTSDLAVAAECETTLAALGHRPQRITDVGVAGLHRLTAAQDEITRHDLIVAVAGMEGALPTALAGLVAQPIIAVPTSAGYGTSFEGITAMLSMLATCSPGITVVGIDNGFGAAFAAHRMLGLRSGAA